MRGGALGWRPPFVPSTSAKPSVGGVPADGTRHRGAGRHAAGCALDCAAGVPVRDPGCLCAPRNTARHSLLCPTPLSWASHRAMAGAPARGGASHRGSVLEQVSGGGCSATPGADRLFSNSGLPMRCRFDIIWAARSSRRSAILSLQRRTFGVAPCLALDPIAIAWAAVEPRGSALAREGSSCVQVACVIFAETGGLWPLQFPPWGSHPIFGLLGMACGQSGICALFYVIMGGAL